MKVRLGWPGGRRVAAAALAGAVAASGQAPLGWWFLALPALAAVLWLVADTKGRGAVWTAWFAGAGYFIAALNWIVQPFMVDAAHDGWMAPFALPLFGFGLALFWALAAAALPLTRHRTYGLALALSATELMRGYVLTGFPWALPGHIWIDTPVAQAAALVGANGLTLLTLMVAAGLASLRGIPAALGIAAIAGVWAFGCGQLSRPAPAPAGAMLRLVQPNAAQQAKWDPEHAEEFFTRLLQLTATAPRPDLVIWPETSLPYLMDDQGELTGVIAEAAAGAPVVVGRQRAEGARVWNTLSVIEPDGRLGTEYDKHHLVPFGEYIPFGDALFDWLDIDAFASSMGKGYSAGPGPQIVDFGPGIGRALPLICYEAVFPQDLRGTERPDWLLQITNDAWFGVWTGPFQHAAQARLRAIEQGLPLVRVANTGVTAVYDARGRVTAALPFGTAAYLDAELPGALPPTFYVRFAEWPVLVLLTGLGVLLIRPRRKPAP